jgi:hypothetical protein
VVVATGSPGDIVELCFVSRGDEAHRPLRLTVAGRRSRRYRNQLT